MKRLWQWILSCCCGEIYTDVVNDYAEYSVDDDEEEDDYIIIPNSKIKSHIIINNASLMNNSIDLFDDE